jgi:predicted Na+-dependent transporter
VKRFLTRYWFLLLLVTGAVLAGIAPAAFAWAEYVDLRFVVAPALFLMGWTLPSRSLARALVRPWPALWAAVISYAGLPLAAWAVTSLLPVDDFRIGILIIVCGPCTLASAVLWTRLGGGDDATTMLVVVLTTATSWLVTPGWLGLLTGTPVTVDTLAMMQDLLWTMLLPVGLGQLCRTIGPLAHIASHHRRLLGIVSQLLILVSLLKGVVIVSFGFRQGTVLPEAWAVLEVIGACIGLHLLALAAGLGSSRWLGMDRARQTAVAFSCSQKTLPVALLIFDRYFSGYPLAIMPLVAYHFGQLLVDTFIAEHLHRHAKPEKPHESH